MPARTRVRDKHSPPIVQACKPARASSSRRTARACDRRRRQPLAIGDDIRCSAERPGSESKGIGRGPAPARRPASVGRCRRAVTHQPSPSCVASTSRNGTPSRAASTRSSSSASSSSSEAAQSGCLEEIYTRRRPPGCVQTASGCAAQEQDRDRRDDRERLRAFPARW